jgi:lipoate--protein ligase
MKEYYETGLKDQEIKYKYPKIDINCMDTLENLLNKSLTTKELLERMLRVLHSLNCEIEKGNYSNKMIEDYEEIFKQTKQRNNKLLHGE